MLLQLTTLLIIVIGGGGGAASSENVTLVCDDILQDPEDKSYTIDELKSIPSQEMSECLSQLGKSKMPRENADIIWSSLVKHYGGPSEIPEEKLANLHWVTVAVAPDEYANMTLSSVDVVENFGFFYDLSEDQLNALADRIREDWSHKYPEDYTSYDLIALRQILCALNSSEIDRIHPESYADAAPELATLQKCPRAVLESLARLAVAEKAFGPVDKWDESTITAVGVVMDGLPEDILAAVPNALIESHRSRGAL